MKPLFRLFPVLILLTTIVPVQADLDTGRRCGSTLYDQYLGPMRQTFAKFARSTPAINEVRANLRTAQRFRYYFNPATPYTPQLPAVTEARREGDCKAKSLWLASKMGDRNTRYVIGKGRPNSGMSHAWLLWVSNGTWYALDPTNESDIQPVRSAAVRALGAAGPVAKKHLQEVVEFFLDDLAVPPFGAAETVLQISPLNPQEFTSLLYPLYVYPELTTLTHATAYASSGGDTDGPLIVSLLGRSRVPAKDVVDPADVDYAVTVLEETLKAPLMHDTLEAEIEGRIAEIKSPR